MRQKKENLGKEEHIRLNPKVQGKHSLNQLRNKFKDVRKCMLEAHPDSDKREELFNLLIEISVSINNLDRNAVRMQA